MTSNEISLDAVEPEKKKEPDWQQFESTVNQLLGNSQERIERNSQNQGSRPSDGQGSSAACYDQSGNVITDLTSFRNGQPIVKVAANERGQQTLEIYSNKNAAMTNAPLLRQVFSYQHDGEKLVESRSISSPGRPETTVKSSFNSETLDLTFSVEKGNVRQDIVLDANANAKSYELTDGNHRLHYNINDGRITGVDIDQGDGFRPVEGKDLQDLVHAADISLTKLRAANGIPEPLQNFDAGIDPRGEAGQDPPVGHEGSGHGGNGRGAAHDGNGRGVAHDGNGRGGAHDGNGQGVADGGNGQGVAYDGNGRRIADGGNDPGVADGGNGFDLGHGGRTAFGSHSLIQETHIRHQNLLNQVNFMPGADQDSLDAMTEVFGGGNGGLSFQPEGGHHGLNNAYTRLYFSGGDHERAEALKGLEKEVLEGDNLSALEVLKKLALVDAVRSLRTANTPEEAQEALKKLAGLEAGDKAAKEVLEKFPSSLDMVGGEQLTQTQRESMIETARHQVREERVLKFVEYQADLQKAVTGSYAERIEAIERMEERAKEGLRAGKTEDATLVDKLNILNMALEISETKDPIEASKLLGDMEFRKDAYRSPAASSALSGIDAQDLQARLKSSDPAISGAALQDLKQHFAKMSDRATEFRTKSASDILNEYGDKNAVVEARKEMKKFSEDNFKRADEALAKLLDRNSTLADKQNALQQLQGENEARVRTLRNDGFSLISQKAQLAVQLAEIRESSKLAHKTLLDPNSDTRAKQEAIASLRAEVDKLARSANTNPQIAELVNRLNDDGKLKTILSDLNADGNETKARDAIEKLTETLPDPETMLNDMRLGRILRKLTDNSTPEEFDKAIASLTEEVGANNQDAKDWLSWAQTGRAVSLISNAGSAADLHKANDELKRLVNEGNEHARHSLSGILIADADPKAVSNWYRSGNGTFNDKPIFLPKAENIAKLGKEGEDAFKAIKLATAKIISENLGVLLDPNNSESGKRNNQSMFAALSLAYSHESASKAPEATTGAAGEPVKSELAGILEATLTKGIQVARADELLAGVLDTISSDAPGATALADIYMLGKGREYFQSNFKKLEGMALDGNEAAMRVLALSASGVLSGSELEQRAAVALQVAGKDPEYRQRAIDALLAVNAKQVDKGRVLESLGKIASNYSLPTEVPEELRSALNNGVISQSEATHASATRGILAMAKQWTEKELNSVLERTSAHSVEGFRKVADDIPENLRSKLLDALAKRANPAIAGSAESKLIALQSLAAMSSHLSRSDLAKIVPYGGEAGLKALSNIGIKGETAQKIQTEAGNTVLAAITRGSSDVRADAFSAIEKYKYGGITNNGELRTVLLAMSKNEPFNLELFEKVNKLVYDTGLPRPLAGILKNWGVPSENDKELFERAAEATKQLEDLEPGLSGEQMLRRVAANIELFNSLPPQARLELFRGPISKTSLLTPRRMFRFWRRLPISA